MGQDSTMPLSDNFASKSLAAEIVILRPFHNYLGEKIVYLDMQKHIFYRSLLWSQISQLDARNPQKFEPGIFDQTRIS